MGKSRSIGSRPTPKDPETERVRHTLQNPFGKKYGPNSGKDGSKK